MPPSANGSSSNLASQNNSRPGSRPSSRPASPPHSTTEPHIAEIEVESVLFDMDGTLINSSPAVVTAWNLFAEKYPLDLEDILKSAHGMRTIDVLRKWCKIEDPEVLASEVVRFETAILNAAQSAAATGGAGIEVLPGVAKLLDDLSEDKAMRDGKEAWAICTSSTFFYASKAIPTAGLTTPKVFVTADSVTRGKPFPDPYLLGAKGCEASIFESLVVEDAPTGIRSGKASGARVLATCTSHTAEELEKERPDFLVKDLSHVSVKWDDSIKRFKMVIEQPVGRRAPAATPDSTPLVTPAVSRAASFSSINPREFFRGSDDLTGNDSVVGTPANSRPGSPDREYSTGGAEGLVRKPSYNAVPGGVSLDGFKRALAGNASKSRRSSFADERDSELAREE